MVRVRGGWEWWGVLGFCQRVALSGVILSGRHSGTCACTRALGRLKCYRGLECRGSGGDGNGDYDEISRSRPAQPHWRRFSIRPHPHWVTDSLSYAVGGVVIFEGGVEVGERVGRNSLAGSLVVRVEVDSQWLVGKVYDGSGVVL